MPSNNNTSKSSNSSLSFGKGKNSMAILALVILIVIIVVAYYHMYKSNRGEGFTDDEDEDEAEYEDEFKMNSRSDFTDGPPNLTPKSGECIVALFYADWCPHCVKFKPDFKKAKAAMDGKMHKSKTMRFEMVDCDKYKDLSKKYDVSGFPTVKLLNGNGADVEYDGERSYEGLKKYLVTND
uniref:Thioredoxin domain-containing protein n=1 Tax=viral metagenome TaxID=1070528 RepID=A0A6C0F149_9ZZZZ